MLIAIHVNVLDKFFLVCKCSVSCVVNDVHSFPDLSTMMIQIFKISQLFLKPQILSMRKSCILMLNSMLITSLFVFQYQWCQPQGSQSSAAAPSAPDLQWCVCQVEQGLNQHAQDCWALHCLGVRLQSHPVMWHPCGGKSNQKVYSHCVPYWKFEVYKRRCYGALINTVAGDGVLCLECG